MYFKKLIAPMFTFLFAIGMLLANPKVENDPNHDYVLTNEGVVAIQEITCGEGDKQCRAQLEQNGPIYNVFDDASLSIPKEGDGSVATLY